ncbi:MAG TPA: HAD-IIA family hydrolase [Solirubrobacterales bacterium]|nr:HAD-IIA family hydrolase [Solirubrobacterales bacterium]
MALADDFDGLLIDLDGVVWIGREPVPGSPEALRELLGAGKQLVFVTNNPTHPPADYARRLGEMGVEVGPERIVTAGMVAARLAADAAGAGAAFVIGAEPLKEMVAAGAPVLDAEHGAEAAVVVVSGHRGFDFAELLAAKRALDRGAALVATSRDPTMPMPGGEWPGTGAILAAVETASGKRAEIAGKPERHLFELALERLGCSFAPEDTAKEQRNGRVAMVGDRPSSDVAGGPAAGLTTVLVLSGTTEATEAAAAEPAPDHVVADLAALLA